MSPGRIRIGKPIKSIVVFFILIHQRLSLKLFLANIFPVSFSGKPGHSVPGIFYNSQVWDFGFLESWADSKLTANQLQFLESAAAGRIFQLLWNFWQFFFSENYHLFDPPLMILRTFLEQILIRICILPFKRNNFQFILISKMFIMIFDVQRKSMHKFWKVLEAVRSKNAF